MEDIIFTLNIILLSPIALMVALPICVYLAS